MAKLSEMGGGLKVSRDDIFQVGDIKQSLLTVAQFQELHSDKWVLLDGRDIAGSKYAALTGNTVIPDIAGKFLRAAGGNAAPLGTSQGQATARNGLGLAWSSSTVTTSGSKANWSSANASTNNDTHTHTATIHGNGSSGPYSNFGEGDQYARRTQNLPNDTHNHTLNKNQWNNNQNNHTHSFNKNAMNTSQSWSGDTETRPVNLTVNMFIKIN